MLNNKIFPFEKNRFYRGKLLTSSDFQQEQNYFNNKRHFLNKILFGSGIISGFKTYTIDDTTLMIESGVAIDSQGREVILEESVAKKLSTLDGFSDVKSNNLKLYVEYKEKEVAPVYALIKNDEGREYEYNRVIENIKFTIKDAESVEYGDIDEKFIECNVLYEDENFKLKLKVPKFACNGLTLKLVASLKKLSNTNVDFSGEFVINFPGFVTKEGENKLKFEFNKVKLEEGKSFEISHDIKIEGVLSSNKTTFVIKENTAKFNINGKLTHTLQRNIFMIVEIKNKTPMDLVMEQITNVSMEQLMQEIEKPLCIANIEVVKVDQKTYVINNVTRPDVYGNIYVPIQQYAIKKLLDYYREEKETPVVLDHKKERHLEHNSNINIASALNSMISSGSFDIPIGNTNAKKAFFSDEVIHGLGKGEVFVEFGIEYVIKDKDSNISRKILYGDSSVFKENLPFVINMKKAVQIFCEKGTFMVGVQFDGPVNISSLKIKWIAFKTPKIANMSEGSQQIEKSIFVKKDTLVTNPNEMVCIDVGFKNMQATTLKYEIIDKDGGTISDNGMYCAPNKEGVYEIKVSCVNAPEIFTYAYIVVVKKDAEND